MTATASPQTLTAAPTTAEAAQHFAATLRFETDPSDVKAARPPPTSTLVTPR